jgi:5-methylcytosine-specific restriction enzyme subunit McrC
MEIILLEHCEYAIELDISQKKSYSLLMPRKFPSKRNQRDCYSARIVGDNLYLKADYYIGIDWLIKGEHFIQVKPKLNKKVLERFNAELKKEVEPSLDLENEEDLDFCSEMDNLKQVNYLKLLMDTLEHPGLINETNNLVFIDWDDEQISIDQQDDTLTPFLIVHFMNLLKHIVKKGLKKSYYKVQKNLNNRIKGKILVSTNIKQNVLKNRLTNTYCEHQEFGIDHLENRFLKKVLFFCSNYSHQNSSLFPGNKKKLEELINYCKPAFQLVTDEVDTTIIKNIKHNPFFKEYKEATKIGHYILRRFAYNISKTEETKVVKTPPFWIDMPKLFELYVYRQLLTVFVNSDIHFQLSTYGNALDFLIIKEGSEMVVDAKYKMHYRSSHIHEDIRQVAGYARLNKVYEYLNSTKTQKDIIDCIIIYPSDEQLPDNYDFECVLDKFSEIKGYNRVYKLGIPMPYIEAKI